MTPAERLRAAAFDGFRTGANGAYNLVFSAAVIDRALNYTELCEAAAALVDGVHDTHSDHSVVSMAQRLRRALEVLRERDAMRNTNDAINAENARLQAEVERLWQIRSLLVGVDRAMVSADAAWHERGEAVGWSAGRHFRAGSALRLLRSIIDIATAEHREDSVGCTPSTADPVRRESNHTAEPVATIDAIMRRLGWSRECAKCNGHKLYWAANASGGVTHLVDPCRACSGTGRRTDYELSDVMPALEAALDNVANEA